jgi:hexosaminidase
MEPHVTNRRERSIRSGRVICLMTLLLGAACRPVTQPASTAPRPAVLVPRVVPTPTSMTVERNAPFLVTSATGIVVEGGAEATRVAEALASLLRPSTGFPLLVAPAPTVAAAGSIRLALVPERAALGEEGYELTVTSDAVRLTASRPAGLFRGVQTLRQLLPAAIESDIILRGAGWAIPSVTISDQPRFAWRGAMLDVARHFFTVDEVKQFVDLLALYKLNVLHLHLSDDQGWRIAINSRPRLTSAGSATQVGGGAGGFYSQQDYTDIVRYAEARYVTVVPEIDMPGHSNAALTAHPELSCSARLASLYSGTDVGWSTLCVDKEETYALIDDVVREIAGLTPGPFFHVGGDEVEKLTHEQYARFVERVQEIVARHGKRMVGWEEITKARLRPSTVAQQWKSDSVKAGLQYGTKILLSPSKRVYLDMKYTPETELGLHWAGYIDVRDAYDWDPATYLQGVAESDIVGVEAPVWSETLRNIGAVEYLAVPRLPAIAEVAWTAQRMRDWEDFRVRLAAQAPRWNYLGINYYRSAQVPW